MEGIHSIDVGVMATPVLIEFIMLIGDSAKIDYETGLEDENKAMKKALVNRAMKQFKKESAKNTSEPEDRSSR